MLSRTGIRAGFIFPNGSAVFFLDEVLFS